MTVFDDWCLRAWMVFAGWRAQRHVDLAAKWTRRLSRARDRVFGRTAA